MIILNLNIMNSIKNFLKLIIPNQLLVYRRSKILDAQRKKFHKGCKEFLILVDSLLKRNNLEYWINYGTLLGAYRDHNFIIHDYDIDIGMFFSDRYKVLKLFQENGIKLYIEVNFKDWNNPICSEYRFEYKGAFMDINFYEKINEEAIESYDFTLFDNVDYSKSNVILPCKTEKISNKFLGLSEIDFLGQKFPVPANTEEYIISCYGPNYRIPVKDFDYHDVATNYEIVDDNETLGYFQKYEIH